MPPVAIVTPSFRYARPEALAHGLAGFEDPEVDACYGDLLYVSPARIHAPRDMTRWERDVGTLFPSYGIYYLQPD